MSETLYKKEITAGGKVKYIPVKEYSPELLDSFHEGAFLCVVKPGSRSYSYQINPDFVTLHAAFKLIEDDFIRMLMEASEMRPKDTALTEEEREAWQNMKRVSGEKLSILYGPALVDISLKIRDTITKEASTLLSNPSVKKAWDNFQTIAVLSK